MIPPLKSLAFLGYNNYLIYTNGTIYNNQYNRWLKPQTDKDGYCQINLSADGIVKTFRIHRLVAMAFIPNPEDKPVVNHKDGNKQNNHVDNLEWATERENLFHALESGYFPHKHLGDSLAHAVCKMLELGHPMRTISNNLNVSYDIVKNIKYGETYTSISKDYNIPKAKECSKPVDGDMVRNICLRLSNGMRNCDIVKELDVKISTVEGIKAGIYYTDISSQYNFTPPKKVSPPITVTLLHDICRRLSKKESVGSISQVTGIDAYKIRGIKRRQKYLHIVSKYVW